MIGTVFLVFTVVCFLLLAFSVAVPHVALAPLGAAFYAASKLPWGA